MRHREIDRLHVSRGGDLRKPAGEADARLRPADDLDLLPGERARDAEPECLPDRLLAGEAAGVALGGIATGVAVPLLRVGEAALLEARVARERPCDARDLDQVGAHARHRCSSSHSGSSRIEETMPSGCVRDASTLSGRNLPVRRSTVRMPTPCAPAMSISRSSPTIQVSCGSASSASKAAAKYCGLGLPSTVASTCAAYSRPATKAPESRSGPRFVCHQRLRWRQYSSAPSSSSANARARFM